MSAYLMKGVCEDIVAMLDEALQLPDFAAVGCIGHVGKILGLLWLCSQCGGQQLLLSCSVLCGPGLLLYSTHKSSNAGSQPWAQVSLCFFPFNACFQRNVIPRSLCCSHYAAPILCV